MKTADFNNIVTANGGLDKIIRIVIISVGTINITDNNDCIELESDGNLLKYVGKMRQSYRPSGTMNRKVGLSTFVEEKFDIITYIDIDTIASITFRK